MKAKHIFCAALMMTGTMLLTSCDELIKKGVHAMMESVSNHNYEDSEEWGKVITTPLELGDFETIDVTGAVRVVFTQDTVCHVTAYGNEKAIDKYKIEVEDKELNVKLKEYNGKINKKTALMTVYVSAPYLKSLEVSGAGDVDFEDEIFQSVPLSSQVEGAGEISIDSLEVTDLDLDINGAGDAKITWLKAQGDVSMEVNGAGNLEGNIIAGNIKTEVNGAGDINLNVDCDKVESEVNGAGDVTLKGKCKTLKKSSGRASNVNTDSLEITEK